MRDVLARLFRRRWPAARSAADVDLRLRVWTAAMRYARAREGAAALHERLQRESAIEIPRVLMIRVPPSVARWTVPTADRIALPPNVTYRLDAIDMDAYEKEQKQ